MLEQRGMLVAHGRLSRLMLGAIVAALTCAALAAPAGALGIGNVNVTRTVMGAPLVSPKESGVKVPGVGEVDLSKVGIIKIAPTAARGKDKNILVLEPGTSAAAAYFVPFAKSLVEDPELSKHWQVWAVERRENFLENQKELIKYKRGEVSSQEFFDYYLGYLGAPKSRRLRTR